MAPTLGDRVIELDYEGRCLGVDWDGVSFGEEVVGERRTYVVGCSEEKLVERDSVNAAIWSSNDTNAHALDRIRHSATAKQAQQWPLRVSSRSGATFQNVSVGLSLLWQTVYNVRKSVALGAC
jgi:hypothetical protein